MSPFSFIRLGYYFATRLLARLVRSRTGLELFRESYGVERLLPLTRDDQAALAKFSGCIACGLCDAHFSAYARAARRAFHGPSDLPLAYTRSLPELDALTEYLASLKKGDLEALERICPARIPFRELTSFAERSAAALAGGRPKSLPVLPAGSLPSSRDPG